MKNRNPYFASRKVSTMINDPLKDFQPDVVMVFKHQSTTGKTVIETGNGKPINSIQMMLILCDVIKGNIAGLAAGMNQLQPHPFKVLPGETSCRHPRCQRPESDPIHIKEPVSVQ